MKASEAMLYLVKNIHIDDFECYIPNIIAVDEENEEDTDYSEINAFLRAYIFAYEKIHYDYEIVSEKCIFEKYKQNYYNADVFSNDYYNDFTPAEVKRYKIKCSASNIFVTDLTTEFEWLEELELPFDEKMSFVLINYLPIYFIKASV